MQVIPEGFLKVDYNNDDQKREVIIEFVRKIQIQ